MKAASYLALQRCVGKIIPKPRRRPEALRRRGAPNRPRRAFPAVDLRRRSGLERTAGSETGDGLRLAIYYRELEQIDTEVILAQAQAAITRWAGITLGDQILPTGSRSVYHAVAKASLPSGEPPRTAAATRGLVTAALASPRTLTLESEPEPEPVVDRPEAVAAAGDAPPIPRSFPALAAPLPPLPPPIPRTLPLRAAPASADRPEVPNPRAAAAPPAGGAGHRSLLEILAASRRSRSAN